jgi:hypothetical protein
VLSAFGSSALAQDTLWPSTAVPGTPDMGADSALNMGVRFQSSEAGTISGIRFWKDVNNTGTHVGTLYTDTGTQLAQATFSGESASGWQQVNFTPVSISANTTYVAAYHENNGHWSRSVNYFYTSGYSNPPLSSPESGTNGEYNGCELYSSSAAFPGAGNGYNANFWVDVVFNPSSGSAPGAPTNLQGNAVSTSQINLTWTASTGSPTGYYVYRNGTQVGSPSTNSYSDTGLTANTQYSYYVAAYNSYGTSGDSSTIYVTTQAAGGTNIAPSGTAYCWYSNSSATSNSNRAACPGLNDGNTSTDVDLDPNGSESSSDMYEAGGVIWSSSQTISSVAFINGTWESSGDGSFGANMTLQTTTDGSTWTSSSWTVSPSYTYNASDAGTTFTFSGSGSITVLGVRVSGEVHTASTSSWYENMREVMAYTPSSGGSVPGAPSNLQGNAISTSQINLTWTASTGSPTGYYVYRNGAKVGSPSTNSYSDTGLAAATQYSYYVAAYNSYGTSGDSSTIYVTTQTPAAPTNLQGNAASSSQINLTWTASSGATGYEVFRDGAQVGTPSTNSYSDTGLAASTQYSYYVTATANGSVSADSSTIYVTTLSSGSGLPANLQNFFPVGPDGQPTANIATWAGRKANTLIRIGANENFTSWNSTANANGMHYIRDVDPNNPANDIGNTNLLSWHPYDEPEANGITAATVVAEYNTLKGIDPNRFMSLNFSGGYLLGLQGSCNASCYAAYLPGGDWLMNDIYPVAGWDAPANLVAPNNWVGEAVALLRSWAPTKPVMQFIECAEQNLSWCPQCPAPTPQQFHSEFWDAIVNGARGVFVFPEAISPFYWDNTTSAMQTQMTADWNTTTALTSVLQTTIDPSGMSASVTAPLEAAWRDSGHQYFFVVNTDSNAHNSQTITLTGTGSATQAVVYGESRNVNIVSGVITDNFAANAVHIYQVN